MFESTDGYLMERGWGDAARGVLNYLKGSKAPAPAPTTRKFMAKYKVKYRRNPATGERSVISKTLMSRSPVAAAPVNYRSGEKFNALDKGDVARNESNARYNIMQRHKERMSKGTIHMNRRVLASAWNTDNCWLREARLQELAADTLKWAHDRLKQGAEIVGKRAADSAASAKKLGSGYQLKQAAERLKRKDRLSKYAAKLRNQTFNRLNKGTPHAATESAFVEMHNLREMTAGYLTAKAYGASQAAKKAKGAAMQSYHAASKTIGSARDALNAQGDAARSTLERARRFKKRASAYISKRQKFGKNAGGGSAMAPHYLHRTVQQEYK
jgi:hypothetical protein